MSHLRDRGLSEQTAKAAIDELNEGEALRAHLQIDYGINESDVANPWTAAGSSAISFSFGAALPLIAILLPSADFRIPVTFLAVLLALAVTGFVVWVGFAVKPDAYSWRQLIEAGALAGIGFTVSPFVAGQAFTSQSDLAAVKIAVLIASLIAAFLGVFLPWATSQDGDKL